MSTPELFLESIPESSSGPSKMTWSLFRRSAVGALETFRSDSIRLISGTTGQLRSTFHLSAGGARLRGQLAHGKFAGALKTADCVHVMLA